MDINKAIKLQATLKNFINTCEDAKVFRMKHPNHADNSEYYGPAVAFAEQKVYDEIKRITEDD